MPSLAVFKGRFTPHWGMSLLAMFFMALFIRLGFWQLQRAEEKTKMLTASQVFSKQAPVLWKPQTILPKQYQQIKISGTFLKQTFLLDNQHYHHQLGYHVLSPLLLADDKIVMVDRGWLAADIHRQTLPLVNVLADKVSLSGSAYFPSDKNWALGDIFEKKQGSLIVVELVDTDLISQLLHKSVYPFIIRLNKHEANGYIRDWSIVAMAPERHYAYALQWFMFGLVVFIAFIALNSKKKI